MIKKRTFVIPLAIMGVILLQLAWFVASIKSAMTIENITFDDDEGDL